MDRDWAERQAALRARAQEAIAAAQAAASGRATIPGIVVDSALAAVKLACWDEALSPRERLLLIDDALRLLSSLKDLPRAPEIERPGLVLELLRRTNDLLSRYAGLVRAARAGP